MRKITKIFVPAVCAVMLVFAWSCNDAWEKHYSGLPGSKSEKNLYEYINSQADLSRFAEMLRIAGYDSILSQPQTYTVWAPVNDALQSVDLTDTVTVTELVKNHITRFLHSTAGLESKTVYMLDKKFVLFKASDNQFTFGGKVLIAGKSEISVSNGLIHCIDGYVPYFTNIWEFIGKTPGLDSLRNFLYSQSEYAFDADASVEIGTNDHGQAIYDSVITFTNPVLSQIGSIYVEDSVFSMILPDNTAWQKAYNQIKNGYKIYGAGGAAQQRLNTQWAIVQNLVFRQLIDNPSTPDSIVSTSGNVFKQPAYLFTNAVKHELSNGLAYITDSLRFSAADSWQKAIKVEAENSDYGRAYTFANLYVRSGLGTSYNVSDSKFLMVEPTSVSTQQQNSVTFSIPNTLSGKYKIYCVFVPSKIVSETDVRPYRVSFYLSYMNSAGTIVTESAVDSKNALIGSGKTGATFTTSGTEITKQYVTQIEFPYCNLIKDKSEASLVNVKLKVKNDVPITSSALYNRTFRVDYVILEPVK